MKNNEYDYYDFLHDVTATQKLGIDSNFFWGGGGLLLGFWIKHRLKLELTHAMPVPYEELVKLVPFAIFFSYMCKPSYKVSALNN